MTGDIDETSIPLPNETIDKQQENVYFDINTKHKTHSGEDQDFLENNFYNKHKENIIVYIGEQYDVYGNYLPRGHHPEENDIVKINDIINYNDFINNKIKYEIIEGLSLVDASQLNEFRCGRCKKKFHVFIGNMFNKIPQEALKVIEKALES